MPTRNWKQYNESLVQRGSVTLWLDKKSLKQWHDTRRIHRRGRPEKYSDTAIRVALTLKAVFRLTFRATEGLLREMLPRFSSSQEIKAPDYTLLCKRQSKLKDQVFSRRIKKGEALHLLVDATGMKLYGEGEWKVKQHGQSMGRRWRKLHIAIEAQTQEIVSFHLTELGIQDCQALPRLLSSVQGKIAEVIGDGAYDRFSCYEQAAQEPFRLITPPQHNARTSRERPRNRHKASQLAVQMRDEVIEQVRSLGRAEWKKAVGYHQRSLVETSMYRIKTLLGNRFSTRLLEHQFVEIGIWCAVLNKFTQLSTTTVV